MDTPGGGVPKDAGAAVRGANQDLLQPVQHPGVWPSPDEGQGCVGTQPCTHTSPTSLCSLTNTTDWTLVRSHPESAEGVRCKTRPIEINSKILGWAWQQNTCSGRETRRRLSLNMQRGNEGRGTRCCKKMADQVCTIHDYAFCLYNCVCSIGMPCMISELIHIADCCLFLQVKNKP